MDAKKLEILMTAVDLGSFSRASEVVGYTQSGLTHLVNSLEREIGFPLIVRSHNGISLTEQGRDLMPDIRQFLQANASLENRIQGIREKQTETIRIAAYASIAMFWMPEILYRFRRICPNVDVDLRMVDHALEPFELLQDGKTDVIFASRQNYGTCEWTPLYHELLYAILPRDYPLKSPTEFPLKEFEGKEFLMPYGRFDIDVHAAFKREGVKANEQTVYVDDETVIRMVGKGLGISMMSELMIRGNTDDVLCIPVTPKSIRELGMGTEKGVELSESVRRLKECVVEYTSCLHGRTF
ncbi:MAG: LysR family transcriptional regulator [Lachnospiraceae bacterium]|uniref:LysR family transcriptional regulator n=1 Tax=Lacrimispora indolis TaxID=69825 RepID=UPI0030533E39